MYNVLWIRVDKYTLKFFLTKVDHNLKKNGDIKKS